MNSFEASFVVSDTLPKIEGRVYLPFYFTPLELRETHAQYGDARFYGIANNSGLEGGVHYTLNDGTPHAKAMERIRSAIDAGYVHPHAHEIAVGALVFGTFDQTPFRDYLPRQRGQ